MVYLLAELTQQSNACNARHRQKRKLFARARISTRKYRINANEEQE